MSTRQLAGPALIAAALLAAVPLSRVRTDTQSASPAEVAQQDRTSSPVSALP
ncbi:MAG: hypothetical protein JO111_11520 [Caulobacteraceae bacterium]|nr:hypothetical protein [Caulobacteraceae bacterium]